MIEATPVTVHLFSFGKKRGDENFATLKADLLLDARVAPNPSYDKTIGSLTGDDIRVQNWMRREIGAQLDTYRDMILLGLSTLKKRREPDGGDPYGKPFIVGIFCAHGIHRSRSLKHLLREELRKLGLMVTMD